MKRLSSTFILFIETLFFIESLFLLLMLNLGLLLDMITRCLWDRYVTSLRVWSSVSLGDYTIVASHLECIVHYTASIVDICTVILHISISIFTDAVIKRKQMIDHRYICVTEIINRKIGIETTYNKERKSCFEI